MCNIKIKTEFYKTTFNLKKSKKKKMYKSTFLQKTNSTKRRWMKKTNILTEKRILIKLENQRLEEKEKQRKILEKQKILRQKSLKNRMKKKD